MRAKQVMTQGVDAVTPQASVQEAAWQMRKHNIGILPVWDKKGLVGLLTDRDIALRCAANGTDPIRISVGEIMSRDYVCCHEDDDIKTVAKLMEKKRVRRLPVLNSREHLIGIVSLGDFCRQGVSRDLVSEVLEAVSARRS